MGEPHDTLLQCIQRWNTGVARDIIRCAMVSSTAFPQATPHSHTKGRGGVALRKCACIACRSGLADLNARDARGDTALHLCAMKNNTEIAEVFNSFPKSYTPPH